MFGTKTNKEYGKRQIIIHAHIFKNAGSTIDWILDRNFRSSFIDDRNDHEMLRNPDYLFNLINKNISVDAISSHSLPLPIINMDDWEMFVIVMLRHPLIRIRSVYDFERKQKADTPGAVYAKKYTFKEYVSWRMSDKVSPTIRNMHVRYLTRNSLKSSENLSEEYLLLAKKFVLNNQLIGIVEEFDKSMVVFSSALKKTRFNIDFSYKRQNVTDNKKMSFSKQISKLKLELGGNLYQEVTDKNMLDIKLYDYTTQILEQRYLSIDSASEDIAQIRTRSN